MGSNPTPVGLDPFKSISNTPVFGASEQEALQRDPDLRPYAAITKLQLVGLLSALGEYAIRVGDEAPPPKALAENREAAEAHCALLTFYSRFVRPRASSFPIGDFIFDSAERHTLAHSKYAGGCADARQGEIVHFLGMLSRYSNVAPKLEQRPGRSEGKVRTINAHNALIGFRERPFTDDEFGQSVCDARSRFCEPIVIGSRPSD